MQRSFQHSAEGSTWTKKNHKYIRKEGNRYIYPEDLKKGTRNSYKTGPIKQRSQESQKYKIGREEGIPENGMIRMRQSGKRPVSIDYSKEYLEAMKSNTRGATNRSIFENDSKEVRERRDAKSERFRRAGQANSAVKQKQVERKAKRDRDLEIQELQAMERREKLNSQGSNTKGQEYAKISAPTGKKRAKRLAAEKEIRAKQRRASNDQGSITKGAEYAKAQGEQVIKQRKEAADKRKAEGIMNENEFMNKSLSNKDKKRGYFTVKNGKTVFVPSDETTMKKMNKAEKLVNKIKSKFSKKKKQ